MTGKVLQWNQQWCCLHLVCFVFICINHIIDHLTWSTRFNKGQLWDKVKRHWNAFRKVFIHKTGQLTRISFRSLFKIVWSEVGSNRREVGDETMFPWECLSFEVQYPHRILHLKNKNCHLFALIFQMLYKTSLHIWALIYLLLFDVLFVCVDLNFT